MYAAWRIVEGHAKDEKDSLVKTIHVVVLSIFYLSLDLKQTNEFIDRTFIYQ